ncbi:hypothetical protein [Photobacterium frigidiphilum]|uniref:hypothetical protein n=1 Tax=Photobacterium frigidiphilum TaxID=264736 RepID=UPI0011B1E498|nr:hypothetical protein [Photobacterium frigidiphilum]
MNHLLNKRITYLPNKRVNNAVRLAVRKKYLMSAFIGTVLQNTILLTESTHQLKVGIRYSINKDGALCKTKSRQRTWPYYGYHRR